MEEQNKPEKSWYRKWWGVLIVIVLFLFVVSGSAFGFLVYGIVQNKTNLPKISDEIISPEQNRIISGLNNYFLGPKDSALITIVEFADFACPHCKLSAPILRKLSYKYKDKVKIIFRDYPITTEYSLNLALAGRCAGEQGFFWLMHDELFKSQAEAKISDLKALAATLGVDTAKFNTCYDKQKYNSQIAKDYSDGQSLNIIGTPTFFINGHVLAGDIPEETWDVIILKILSDNK